jgi:NADH dehydrogenase (ubiquinone) Fe-S protein 6
VFCDGGGVLGHPRVFINLTAAGWKDCGYCGRRFVLA